MFKFDSLIIYLSLYFLNEIPGVGKVQWDYDKSVVVHTKEGLQGLGDIVAQTYALWGYFKSFPAKIQSRERIPKEIVEKYENTVCFMVNKDQCHMEVVEPMIVWIIPMGYEVDGNTLDAYAQHLFNKLVDEKEEKFGTFK